MKRMLRIRAVQLTAVALGLTSATGGAMYGQNPASSASSPQSASASPAQSASPGEAASQGESSASTGNASSSADVAQNDAQFIQNAVRENENQIALGLLAIEKGSNDDTKDYGRELIDNHVQAMKNLMDLASRKHTYVEVAQPPTSQDQLNQLRNQSGADFDKAFVKMAVANQSKIQNALQQFIAQAKDADVRDFANQMLTSVGQQISDGRDLASSLGLSSQDLNPPPVAEQPSPAASGTASPAP